MAAFEEFGVMPEIIRAVEEMDWLLPTPVQAESIPLALTGGDLLVAAETGSGKTGAYCLPIIQITFESLKEQANHLIPTGDKSTVQQIQLSTTDREPDLAIDPTGFICQSRLETAWQGGRANIGVLSGRYYYEVTVRDEGLCRIGFSTKEAKLALGTDKEGFGYGGTGKKSFAGNFSDYGGSYGLNDVIGCLIDRNQKTISFSKNGQDLGVAFEIPQSLNSKPLYPAVTLKNAELSFNFGQSPFKHLPINAKGFKEVPITDTGLELPKEKTPVKSKQKDPLAIILAPNRELVEQVCSEIGKFKKYLPFPSITQAPFCGGAAAKKQLDILESGVDIVVGTISRVLDLVNSGNLHLEQVRFLILDEADQLVAQGFSDAIISLYKQIPQTHPTSSKKRLQVMFYSATLHSEPVKKLVQNITKYPTWVDLKGESMIPETVHHTMVLVDPTTNFIKNLIEEGKKSKNLIQTDGIHDRDGNSTKALTFSESIKLAKPLILLRVIKAHSMDRALIFCRTKIDCDNLEAYLRKNLKARQGYDMLVACLHSDKTPEERKENLEKFKTEKIQFLICTDVAARGIDIRGLPYVINLTLPDESRDYVHRIGRVGRAERMGLAISIVSNHKEKVWYHSCPSRGKKCFNTNLKPSGCAIWYDEQAYLQEIEDLIEVPVEPLDSNYQVSGGLYDEDGKVVYGAKRQKREKVTYAGHVGELIPSAKELSKFEQQAHDCYFQLKLTNWSQVK